MFKGFSPRWNWPITLRNSENPNLNTSALLVVIDSARESDLNMVPFFTQDIIGDSEIIVADSAMTHLKMVSDRKQKVEVYWDILGMLSMFTGGDAFNIDDSLGQDELAREIQEELGVFIKENLSSQTIVDWFAEQYDLNVTANNTV